jgi:hypothetical protein
VVEYWDRSKFYFRVEVASADSAHKLLWSISSRLMREHIEQAKRIVAETLKAAKIVKLIEGTLFYFLQAPQRRDLKQNQKLQKSTQ